MHQPSDLNPAEPKSIQSRLLSPEEIAASAGDEAPFMLYPESPAVFADREARLRHLAEGHAMRDYLFFCSRYCS